MRTLSSPEEFLRNAPFPASHGCARTVKKTRTPTPPIHSGAFSRPAYVVKYGVMNNLPMTTH